VGRIGEQDPQSDTALDTEVMSEPELVESTEVGDREPEPMKLWPPTPKTKILVIGLAFFGFQALLMIVFAVALWWRLSQ
jgi:hypothetical protein